MKMHGWKLKIFIVFKHKDRSRSARWSLTKINYRKLQLTLVEDCDAIEKNYGTRLKSIEHWFIMIKILYYTKNNGFF